MTKHYSTSKTLWMNFVAIALIFIASMACAMASEESETLQSIQEEIIIEGATWRAGITTVSGLTDSEKRQLTLPEPIPEPDGEIVSAPSMVMAENQFDWRDEGAMTPVKNQRSCGSCWAFPPVATIESKVLIDGGGMLDLSEQHLVSACCGAGSCSGGYPIGAIAYIRDKGVPDEACSPYVAKNTGCNPCPGWEDRAWKIEDFMYVNSSMSDFKWALREYGPMTVVVRVPDDWYYYRAGIYEPIRNVGWANHAVLLVGWNDTEGCWTIKNSWGTGWGEAGYARVKYGDLEKYNYAYAVTAVIAPDASPDTGTWIKPVSAVASSEYSKTYSSMKAIDNLTSTHWFSKSDEDNPSIIFDLGERLTISKVRAMIHHIDVPMVVNIGVSGDGGNWQTVAGNFEITSGAEYVEISFASIECQYVRMTQIELARSYGTCTEFDACVPDEEDDEEEEDDEDDEPEYALSLEIVYTDRIEMIGLDDDVMNMTLFQNGTPIWKWWGPMGVD